MRIPSAGRSYSRFIFEVASQPQARSPGFEHKWPTTTRHLRVLEDAGLLRQEKHGRARVYTLDKKRLALVSEWLGWFDK